MPAMPRRSAQPDAATRSLPRGAPLIGPLTPQLFRPDAQRPLRGKLHHLNADTQVVPHHHAWGQVALSTTGVVRLTVDRGTYIVGQRQLCRLPALSANGDLARAPVNIVQAQPDNFAGANAEPGEQQQDGMVPPARGRRSIAALQNTLHRGGPAETLAAWKATSGGPSGRKQQDR